MLCAPYSQTPSGNFTVSVFRAQEADRSPMGLIGSQANGAHVGKAQLSFRESELTVQGLQEALSGDLAPEQSLVFRKAFLLFAFR